MKNEIEAKKDGGPSDQLQMSSPLASRALFWPARYRRGSEFLHHMPLAFWLTDVVKPNILVEVGLDNGQSYFGFCQAMERLNLSARCYGFSEEAPDASLLSYNSDNYEEFSTISGRTAVEALRRFKDGSIDFLIVNGALPNETLRLLKDIWGRKLSERAVMLLHNYLETPQEAAVQDMIGEMDADTRVITFEKGHGVAVVLYGSQQDERLQHFARISFGTPEYNMVHSVFSRLGNAHYYEWSSGNFEKELQATNKKTKQALADLEVKQKSLERAHEDLTALQAAYEARNDKIAEMQVALFDLETKREREITTLHSQLQLSQDALSEEKTARGAEGIRAEKALFTAEKFRAEADERQQEIERLTTDLNEAETKGDTLTHERDTARAEADERQQEIERLTTELNEAETIGDTLTQERDTARAEADERQQEIERLTTELNEAVTKGDTLTHERDTARAEADERQQEIERLTTELNEAEIKGDTLTHERDTARAEADERQQEIERLTTELNEAETKGDTLTHERDTARAEADERQQEIERLTTELNEAETIGDTLTQERDTARAEADERQQEIERLTTELNEAVTKGDTLTHERDAARAEADRVRMVHSDEVVVLTSSLMERDETIQRLVSEQERASKRQTTELNEAKTKGDTLTHERDKARAEAEERQQEIERLTTELNEAVTKGDTLTHERDAARAEADRVRMVHSDEVVVLTSSLMERDETIQRLVSEQERASKSEQCLDLSQSAANIEYSEDRGFNTRYLAVQVRLRELQIAQLRSWRRPAVFGRFLKKRLLAEKARTITHSTRFNAKWYLNTYPDVKECGIDPALHFVADGFFEGRITSPDFDFIEHLVNHPDLMENDAFTIIDALFRSREN